MSWYKRWFDITLSLVLMIALGPLCLMIACAIKATSKGPVVHWSRRVGRYNRFFFMPKFRSMRADTPQIATHLLADPAHYLTSIGSFLRRTSLDELPQLLSILLGDMSFVGPRPALFNQDDLVKLRTEVGVDQLVPGLTGWAQVNGRDMLAIAQKVRFDYEYLRRRSFVFDIAILSKTLGKVLLQDGIDF